MCNKNKRIYKLYSFYDESFFLPDETKRLRALAVAQPKSNRRFPHALHLYFQQHTASNTIYDRKLCAYTGAVAVAVCTNVLYPDETRILKRTRIIFKENPNEIKQNSNFARYCGDNCHIYSSHILIDIYIII